MWSILPWECSSDVAHNALFRILPDFVGKSDSWFSGHPPSPALILNYYGGSAPPSRLRWAWQLAGIADPGARSEVLCNRVH